MEEEREHNEQQQQQPSTIATTTFVNQSTAAAPPEDDAWWWEVENGDLILDLVPNIEVLQQQSESENINNNDSVSVDFTVRLKYSESNTTTSTTNTRECGADTELTENVDIDHASVSSKELRNKYPTTTPTTSIELPDNIHASCKRSSLDSHDLPVAASTTDIEGLAAIAREQTLEEFKEELRIKRLARQTAVQDLRDEISTLRRQLADEQELTRRLRRNNAVELSPCTNEEVPSGKTTPGGAASTCEVGAIGGALYTEPDSDDEDPQSRGRHANIELANAQLALQMANAENLSLRTELGVVQKQVSTLKEVIACCKQMLNVKEEQCTQDHTNDALITATKMHLRSLSDRCFFCGALYLGEKFK